MEITLFLSILVSFLITFYLLPAWINRAKLIGLIGKDINKYEKGKVAEAGGIIVITGFIIGLLSYIAIRTFILKDSDGITIQIFALISSVMMLAFIGMVDSLLAASSNSAISQHIKGWRKGIRRRYRLILCLCAAIPLIVINAGSHIITLPFMGPVELGIFYALILIPLGIVGTSTTFNFLAGFNGLEAGQGIIILSFLSLIAYLTGTSWLAISGLCMVAALIAFFYYNKFPAKVFPSDVLTYPVGGLIAIMAILGNFEKIALFIFIPYVIEVILKSRGGLRKQSFGIPDKDNNLKMPYEKIYGLTHLGIFILSKFKKEVKEKDVVYLIFGFQILMCFLSLIIFRSYLF